MLYKGSMLAAGFSPLNFKSPIAFTHMNTVQQNHTHISKNILMKKLSFCKHFIILQMKHLNPLQTF